MCALEGEETPDEAPAYGDFALKRFLGMEMSGVEAGHGRARIDVGEAHLNPNGVVHGAVLFAMVDTAMGKATSSLLEEGRYCASVEVSLRFVRAASSGALVADATVVRRGRSIVHLEARVHDADERLIATAAGTFAVLGG
jgi:uncharacterized protein (TIGR00369 family)